MVTVPAGTTVHDKATLTGAFGTPTGTVTFTFFTASSVCTGASVAAGTVALDRSGVWNPATRQGPLRSSSCSFRAHYNGEDPNYAATDSPCEPLTVEALTLPAVGAVDGAIQVAWASVEVGTPVFDLAANTDALDAPTATVAYAYFPAASLGVGTAA